METLSRRVGEIMWIARFFREKYRNEQSNVPDEDSRTLQFFLFAHGERTWAKCQPTVSENNTWIEVYIPCEPNFLDRLYYFLDLLVHTLLPWGWVNFGGI